MMQDRKYEFIEGGVRNRASGEVIPADEPVFVFRARDVHAARMLFEYSNHVRDKDHRAAILIRLADFCNFAAAHQERMKEPDTEPFAEEPPE